MLCIKSLFAQDIDCLVKWAKYLNLIGLTLTIITVIGYFVMASGCTGPEEGILCTIDKMLGRSNYDNKPNE